MLGRTMDNRYGYAPVQDGELLYEVAGDGPGLVFIHAGVAHMGMWDEQWASFITHFRCLRYDTRGFGGSRTQPVSFSNRQDLIDVMDFAGLERAAVIGCSRGAQIALDAIIDYPDRFLGLVAVCGGVSGFDAYTGTDVPDAEMALFDALEKVMDSMAPGNIRRTWELEAQLWIDGPGQPGTRLPAETRARLMALNWVNLTRQDNEAKGVPMQPPAALRLWDVRVPVLAISGRFDTIGSQRSMAYLAQQAPEGRLVEMNTAHLPSVEQPGLFNEIVLAFLAGLDSAPASA